MWQERTRQFNSGNMNLNLTRYKELHRIIYSKSIYVYAQLDRDCEADIHVI